MKNRLYLILAVCIVMLSGACNTAFAVSNPTDYGASDETTLDSALTDTAHTRKSINVDSDINLQNNLSQPSGAYFVINGNNNSTTTIIDGGGKTGIVTPLTSTTTINDLTLTNFVAPLASYYGQPTYFGGAILNRTGNINIYNSHFTNNIANSGTIGVGGGAIANYDYINRTLAGTVNIYNSSFENNRAGTTTNGIGGAIFNDGTMNIYSSTFTKNTSAPSQYNSIGGAIYNSRNLTISNSTFGSDIIADGNKAYEGGAIYNDGINSSNTFIYNSTFKNNSATYGGGAISTRSTLKITDSAFINNTATERGGAIYNNTANAATYIQSNWKNVVFTGNQATLGGAIYNGKNLCLTANTSGMNFSGNTGDDIYNEGTTWLNAGIADMTFGSGIITTAGHGIYINAAGGYLDNNGIIGDTPPTTGRVVLNSALTGAGTVELRDGTLEVGTAGSIGASGAGNSISALTLGANSTLDLADGTVNDANVYANNLTIGTGTNIWLDTDLSALVSYSDKFNVSSASVNSGSAFTFRIQADDEDLSGGTMTVLSNGGTLLGINSVAYTNTYKYNLLGDSSGGFSYTTTDGINGLTSATADTVANRSFSLVDSNYNADSSYTLSAGTDAASTKTLTVFGTGKSGLAIDGNNAHTLFAVPQYAKLNIVDAVIKNAAGTDVWGAAINNAGTLNVYGSLFNNNRTTKAAVNTYGGAICNTGTAYIANSDFTGNYSSNYGGAIANRGAGATMNIYNSNFTNNTNGTNGNSFGGAISNSNGAILNVSDSTFGGNDYSSANYSRTGGAIRNGSIANIYNSTFKFNKADGMYDEGGAISNTGGTNVYNSTFDNNKGYLGGAINNSWGVVNLYNSTFTNNIATNKGGAIYSSGGSVNLIASGQDVTFSGNTATNGGNDIYLESGATLNLNSSLGSKITFNGGIESSAIENGTININKVGSATAGDPPTGVPITGEVVLAAPIETSTVNLYNGTLTLNNDSYLNGNALAITGGTLNMQNNAIGTMSLDSLAVNGGANLKIDANLTAGTSDKIEGAYAASTDKLYVSSIRLLNDSTTNSTTTQLLGSGLIGHDLVTMGVTKAYTPIYQYNVSYNDTTGQLAFAGVGGGAGGGGFNPAILNAPVSANVGAYMAQVATYNEALSRSELFMSLPQQERLLMKQRNMYANVGGNDVQPEVFSPTFLPDEKGGLWFKQYTSFENIPMNNGPNVSNVGYGALVGADSPMYHLKNGYDGYVTAYVGYNGSHQNYDNVGVNQNGGALGLTGSLYKGNFFTALTASVGESIGQANTMYGVDNFNTLLAGLALKSGYNIEMNKGKFILQPSLLAAYTFANTFDYTTASGVNMTSDPMNAIQIAPGVKFIVNMKNGWQPYLATNMVFNIMDNQKFQANNVQLPQMSIAPYIEYGLGVQRRWGERFTGFGQAMLRGGGRNGIALQFGFRYALGK